MGSHGLEIRGSKRAIVGVGYRVGGVTWSRDKKVERAIVR